TWVLGISSCALIAFLNEFFVYRQNQIGLDQTLQQLGLLALGRLMAATLPAKCLRIPWTGWKVSLNPGPFNIKEHALVMILASSGSWIPYASEVVPQMKAFYHREINPWAALLLIQTSQVMGYGFAGVFMKFLVDSPYMWWPSTLVDVSTYSFAYYVVPNYFFPSIMALSFSCWIWKSSITAQQIGSGFSGLGVGSIGLDWSTIAAIGNPMANPAFTIFNTLAGFILAIYVVTPLVYWRNAYNARRFPIFSAGTFDEAGGKYNISRVLDSKRFELDKSAYEEYSPLYMSAFLVVAYGFSFAAITATLVHVALYNGRSIWRQYKQASSSSSRPDDIHTRLMKNNYKSIPQSWFIVLLLMMLGLSILTVEGFDKQFQLPFVGVLLACAMAFILLLPFGVLEATTSRGLDLAIISEMISGYLYPGKPLAAFAFKSYATSCMGLALNFLKSFKFGHYMKIPPRSMFIVQIVGTVIACSVDFATAWWLLSTVHGICDLDKLPAGSPWTCPSQTLTNSRINIWAVIGPARIFGSLSVYSSLYYYFLYGAFATVLVWIISRLFPKEEWIRQVNVPLIFAASTQMPYAKPVNYWSWFIVAFFFNYVVYRKWKVWWSRYNYVLSNALTCGVALMALLGSIFQFNGINGIGWWGQAVSDHCPLAHCPTAPGIEAKGCPLHH
ncbi:Oligopeptide transporter 5, partial [Ananas comosus]